MNVNKGQLISEGNFGAFKSTKINVCEDFCPRLKKEFEL